MSEFDIMTTWDAVRQHYQDSTWTEVGVTLGALYGALCASYHACRGTFKGTLALGRSLLPKREPLMQHLYEALQDQEAVWKKDKNELRAGALSVTLSRTDGKYRLGSAYWGLGSGGKDTLPDLSVSEQRKLFKWITHAVKRVEARDLSERRDAHVSGISHNNRLFMDKKQSA